MDQLTKPPEQGISLARWAARLFSLLIVGFLIVIVVFNEDVRSTLTLPSLLYLLVIVLTLVSWRWEREGGLLTIGSSLIFLIVTTINAVARLDISLVQALLSSIFLILPFLIVGGLFAYAGRTEV